MSKSKLTRREFLLGASVVSAGGVLAACAAPTPTPAPAQEPVEQPAEQPVEQPAEPAAAGKTIEYWFGWGNLNDAVWDKMKATDEYKAAIGNNTLEQKGSVTQEALLTAVAAGTPPDGASNTQYLDYMARGVLVPVEDLVAASSIIKKENYLEGSWNDAFYKGTMYGVPALEGFIRYGLDYNADMVEKAGLDPDNPPQTWSECFAWHEKITQFDDAGNLKAIGFDPYDAMGGQCGIQDGFYPAVSWNFKWFDPDTGKFDLANEKMIEAFNTYAEFYKFVGPDKVVGMRSVEGQGGWGGSFNTGVQAMLIEGYWHPGETQIQKPEIAPFNRATWAPVPDSRKGAKVQGTGGHYIIMFKDGGETEEMFKIGEFLNTNAACDIIFNDIGWLPGLIPYLDVADAKKFPGLEFYFNSVKEATEWSSPARCPITAFTSTQWQELHDKVDREQMTGEEAAAELQKRCEDEWKAQGLS